MDLLQRLKNKIVDDLYKDWFLSLDKITRLCVGIMAIVIISAAVIIFN